MTTLLHPGGRVHVFTENRPVSPRAWTWGIDVEIVAGIVAGIVHPAALMARPVRHASLPMLNVVQRCC
ncbi:hypothetical protein AAH991_29125 [Microbispora sp. ZYX-F-249]|uniref:Uncharacterized protein n=1 Tax=Microbispora maris TaxID=3144104 RepID=A0ABV0AX64_9ACTN